MNNEITNRRLTPRRAIVVYHDNNMSNFYLESREIKTVKGKCSFMTPTPLANNVIKEIAQSFAKKDSGAMTFGKLIGGHLLHGTSKPGQTIVMWYRPQMKRLLNFSGHLRIKGDKPVSIPATLYLVIDKKLYLYALMTGERPDMKTKLYNAPFLNIYADGNVCLGTAAIGKQKAKTFELEAERFERAFYMAEQNGGQVKQCNTSLEKLWTSLMKKQTPFPSKQELLQHATFKTLGDLFAKLIGNNDYEDE